MVNNQVSAAMDPFQDRRSHRRLEIRKVVARNGDKIESAEINPRIRQAVRRNHFRKRGRVRRAQIAEAIRVARAAGRRDVTRAIHRPGRDHEHGRRRLDAERRRAADETHVRWQLASLVVDAKQPLSKRRERNGKRETDGRVLIHANDPLDRRPMRPVGGSDFEHQRPRASLIRDLHSHRKIATDECLPPSACPCESRGHPRRSSAPRRTRKPREAWPAIKATTTRTHKNGA